MSEENTGTSSSATGEAANNAAEADPIKNLKGEFNRKIDSNFEALNQKLEQLAAALKPAPAPAKSEPTDDIGDLVYTNPKEYARRVADMATAAATSSINTQQNQNNRQQRVINELISEFPELQQNESPIYKKAVELYGQLDESDKTQMSSWKSVVYKAAMDLDMKPKSKRVVNNDDDDSFVLNSTSNPNRPARKKSDVDPLTVEFSRLLGRNPDDPKVKEGLKQAVTRQKWTRYK